MDKLHGSLFNRLAGTVFWIYRFTMKLLTVVDVENNNECNYMGISLIFRGMSQRTSTLHRAPIPVCGLTGVRQLSTTLSPGPVILPAPKLSVCCIAGSEQAGFT